MIAAYIGFDRAWHGYNDHDSEGAWVWDNRSHSVFTYWNAGEPNDANLGEDCAQLYSSNGRWNDENCALLLPYICESNPCPNDPDNDIDGDGVCGDVDTCPTVYNPGQVGLCR